MKNVQSDGVTCNNCKEKFSVDIDNTWKCISSETVTEKKLFGSKKVSVTVWEKEAECPKCLTKGTCQTTARLNLG